MLNVTFSCEIKKKDIFGKPEQSAYDYIHTWQRGAGDGSVGCVSLLGGRLWPGMRNLKNL